MANERTALYLRLSREDGSAGESGSIASQRMALQGYAAAHGFCIAGEYVDDGVSGTQWERPAFQALLQAIRAGQYDIVLTKDLSRLSRDYIHTGELVERWFPMHGVRFIAVADGIDTATGCGSDLTPIRAVMNDWYAKDISRKVRAALYARQQNGICTLAHAPYGYRKAAGNLVPIPKQAVVVTELFRRYRMGESCRSLAQGCTAQAIPTPSGGMTWNDVTIRRILRNPVYKGELLLHTTQTISYKCRKPLQLPPTAWIRMAVPALISSSEFEAVQQLLTRQGHQKRQRHWLCGRVRCGQCGSRMVLGEHRLLCGGRRRGNGCTNPSQAIEPLLHTIAAALHIQDSRITADILPYLVTGLTLTESEVQIDLLMAKP